jgi:hypothetical protein
VSPIQKLLPCKQTLWFGLMLDPHTVGATDVVQYAPDLLGLVPIPPYVSECHWAHFTAQTLLSDLPRLAIDSSRCCE